MTASDRDPIPISGPLLDDAVARNVAECVRSGWISSAGPFVREFEGRWASYCGMPHGVAVSSGTMALRLAVAMLELEPGAEVIMPTLTIISCALAVVAAGGVPVLVDSDPRTWCMDVRQLEAKITPRTRAIMPVHLYGHPVDMQPVMALARHHGLTVIEDAAEAHGAMYRGQRAGGLGDISCFSFYANKLVTTGEGGMVLVRRDDYAARLQSLRNLCFRPERRFYHTELGYNARLTNLQAAVGVAQVDRIAAHLAHRRWLGGAYAERLRDLPRITLPVEEPWATNVYWMYGVVLADDVGCDAAECARRLEAFGIETRPFFVGMHEQPALHARGLFGGEHYPVAERLTRRGLCLPSGLGLTLPQLDRVCDALRRAVA